MNAVGSNNGKNDGQSRSSGKAIGVKQDCLTVSPEDAILITGANGFIGSRVVKNLLDRGFRNLVCVRERQAIRAGNPMTSFNMPESETRWSSERDSSDHTLGEDCLAGPGQPQVN